MIKLLDALTYLDSRDREQILQLSSEMRFTEGQVLLREGAPVKELLVVLQGSVRVELGGEGQAARAVTLGPGALLGEVSFLTGEVASASVVGAQPGVALRIPHSLMEGLSQEDGAFGTRLYQSIALLLARRLRGDRARFVPAQPSAT